MEGNDESGFLIERGKQKEVQTVLELKRKLKKFFRKSKTI